MSKPDKGAEIADLARSWSDGYRAGLADGVRWSIDKSVAGVSPNGMFDAAKRMFAGVGDSISRYWHGASEDYGRHAGACHDVLAGKMEKHG